MVYTQGSRQEQQQKLSWVASNANMGTTKWLAFTGRDRLEIRVSGPLFSNPEKGYKKGKESPEDALNCAVLTRQRSLLVFPQTEGLAEKNLERVKGIEPS
jgi:hypothetical protein